MLSERIENLMLNRELPSRIWLLNVPGRIEAAMSIDFVHATDDRGQPIFRVVENQRYGTVLAYLMVRPG